MTCNTIKCTRSFQNLYKTYRSNNKLLNINNVIRIFRYVIMDVTVLPSAFLLVEMFMIDADNVGAHR
jgi:hypothetical protein